MVPLFDNRHLNYLKTNKSKFGPIVTFRTKVEIWNAKLYHCYFNTLAEALKQYFDKFIMFKHVGVKGFHCHCYLPHSHYDENVILSIWCKVANSKGATISYKLPTKRYTNMAAIINYGCKNRPTQLNHLTYKEAYTLLWQNITNKWYMVQPSAIVYFGKLYSNDVSMEGLKGYCNLDCFTKYDLKLTITNGEEAKLIAESLKQFFKRYPITLWYIDVFNNEIINFYLQSNGKLNTIMLQLYLYCVMGKMYKFSYCDVPLKLELIRHIRRSKIYKLSSLVVYNYPKQSRWARLFGKYVGNIVFKDYGYCYIGHVSHFKTKDLRNIKRSKVGNFYLFKEKMLNTKKVRDRKQWLYVLHVLKKLQRLESEGYCKKLI